MLTECPTEGMLQAYADGELAGDEVSYIGSHLQHCPKCQRLFNEIDTDDHWLTAVFQREAGDFPIFEAPIIPPLIQWPHLGIGVLGVFSSIICWIYWPLLFSPETVWTGGALGWLAINEVIDSLWGTKIQLTLSLVRSDSILGTWRDVMSLWWWQ